MEKIYSPNINQRELRNQMHLDRNKQLCIMLGFYFHFRLVSHLNAEMTVTVLVLGWENRSPVTLCAITFFKQVEIKDRIHFTKALAVPLAVLVL